MSAQRIPWRFRDLETSETYFLPVNPLTDSGSFGVQKQTKYEAAVATYRTPGNDLRVDNIVIQDSPDDIKKFSFEGTLYSKEEYEAFVTWARKSYPWELRDDLGREFLVMVEEFAPVRSRSAKFRWKHTYSLSGVVFRELGV